MNKRRLSPKPGKRGLSYSWRLHVVLLAVLAFGVYCNSLANGFAGDDQEQLLQNPLVSGHHVAAAFGSGVWTFRGVHGNYYRPLQFVLYIFLHAFFGFQAFWFHAFFVLLHAVNTILVYCLTVRIEARRRVALAAGVLFALHPIHTEVVDWVAALPDLMLTTIVIFALWWFARQAGSPRGWQIVGHSALFLAALMSKETGVMLLPLYVGFEWICLARPWRELKRNIALYSVMLGTFGLYLAARWSALGGLAPGQQTFYHLTPVEFCLSAVVTAAEYIRALALPLDLNYFHIFQATRTLTPAFLISLAVLVALAVAALRQAMSPAARYGIFWFALTLAPALNLTGVGQNVFTERYLYLPSVGFGWIAGIAWTWWSDRQPKFAWAAAIAILSAGAWQITVRNSDWRDDLTLLQKTVVQSPGAGILHNNLAGVYVQQNDFNRALGEEVQAVRLEPRSAPFHKNLGLLLMARDPRSAVPQFEEALRLQPSDVQSRNFLEEARNPGGR